MTILQVEPGKTPMRMNISGDLASMQKMIGGTIQAIYPFEEPVALVCHEEGKVLNLPLNRILCHPETNEPYDIIAGTFFLCAALPDSDHFDSLSKMQIRLYTEHFQYPELFCRTPDGLLCITQKI